MEENDLNETWTKIKTYVIESVNKAFGTRTVNTNERKNKKPWFTNR